MTFFFYFGIVIFVHEASIPVKKKKKVQRKVDWMCVWQAVVVMIAS